MTASWPLSRGRKSASLQAGRRSARSSRLPPGIAVEDDPPGGGLSNPLIGFLWVWQAATARARTVMASNGSGRKGRARVMVAPEEGSPCETTLAPIGEKMKVGFPPVAVRSSKGSSGPW